MAEYCDTFSHILAPLDSLGDLEKVVVLSATITSIDSINNQADISYTTTVGVPANYPDLISTAVPFFYHCENSNGSVDDLAKGYRAFDVTDSVYIFHFPDTPTSTFIIGHVNIPDVRACGEDIIEIKLSAMWAGLLRPFKNYVTYYNPALNSTIIPLNADGTPAPFTFPVIETNVDFILWKSRVLNISIVGHQFTTTEIIRTDTGTQTDQSLDDMGGDSSGYTLDDVCDDIWRDCLYISDDDSNDLPRGFVLRGHYHDSSTIIGIGNITYTPSELTTDYDTPYLHNTFKYYSPPTYATYTTNITNSCDVGSATLLGDYRVEEFTTVREDFSGLPDLGPNLHTLGYAPSTNGMSSDKDVFLLNNFFACVHSSSMRAYNIIGHHYDYYTKEENISIYNGCLFNGVRYAIDVNYEKRRIEQHNRGSGSYFDVYPPWYDRSDPVVNPLITIYSENCSKLNYLYSHVVSEHFRPDEGEDDYCIKTLNNDNFVYYVNDVTHDYKEQLPMNGTSMLVGHDGVYGATVCLGFTDTAVRTYENNIFISGRTLTQNTGDTLTSEVYDFSNFNLGVECAINPDIEVVDPSSGAVILDMNNFEKSDKFSDTLEDLVLYVISEEINVSINTLAEYYNVSTPFWCISLGLYTLQ